MKLWIARDKEGLTLFEDKPKCHNITNIFRGKVYVCIPEDSFPEVTFENSPQEVELKLVNEIVGVAESPLKTFPRVNEFETGASYRR